MTKQLSAILLGVTISGAILVIEHFGLWRFRHRFWLPLRYAAGTVALNIGATVAIARGADPVAAIWSMAVSGGALVGALHLWRLTRVSAAVERLARRAGRSYVSDKTGNPGPH